MSCAQWTVTTEPAHDAPLVSVSESVLLVVLVREKMVEATSVEGLTMGPVSPRGSSFLTEHKVEGILATLSGEAAVTSLGTVARAVLEADQDETRRLAGAALGGTSRR